MATDADRERFQALSLLVENMGGFISRSYGRTADTVIDEMRVVLVELRHRRDEVEERLNGAGR